MISYKPKRYLCQQKYETVITDSLLRVDIYSFRSRGIRLRGGTPPRRLVASCQPPAPPSHQTFPEPLRAAFFTRGTRAGILVDWKKEVRGGLADRSLLLSSTPPPTWPLTLPSSTSPYKHLECLLMVLLIVLFIVYCGPRALLFTVIVFIVW